MINNKQGQILLVRIMISILVLAFIIIIVQPVQQSITISTNITNSSLDCDDPTINNINKVTCTFLQDGLLFYFIGTLIAVSLAIVQGKKTILGIIESITIFMVLVLLISPLKSLIIMFRNNLSCGAAGLSVGANMLCIFIDLWLFYFFVIVIAALATYTFNKLGEPKNE